MATTNFTAVQANLGPSLRFTDINRYFYTKFEGGTPFQQEIDGTAAVVSDNGINMALIEGQPGARTFGYALIGAFAGTAPQLIAGNNGAATRSGLTMVLDAAADGLIFGPPWCTSAGDGTLLKTGWGIFTSQTDSAFVKCKLVCDDVSDNDELAVGFRKVAAQGNALTDFTDYFVLNLNGGSVNIESNLNNGTDSIQSTSMTVADQVAVTFEVHVSTSGAARAFVNGADPTVNVTNFTFDSGDLLVPFIINLNVSTADSVVTLLEWESGTFDQGQAQINAAL